MMQRAGKSLMGLIMLGVVLSPTVAMSRPTHRFSANLSGHFAEFDFAGFPLVPVGMPGNTIP
jgi:hypothetical protein